MSETQSKRVLGCTSVVMQPLDEVLDAIMDFVDNMMFEGQWAALDAFCGAWSLHVGLDRTLCLLTATLPGKDHMPLRAEMLARAKREFVGDVFHGLG